MKTKHFIPIAIIALITAIYLWGVASVPFHPDEATQIFMSGDFQKFITQPVDLFHSPTPVDSLRQNYRLLDAPLTRWLIGLARGLTAEPAILTDWNWSLTWQENQAAGALPARELLLISRYSVAWLFALTLYFCYRTGIFLQGSLMGWLLVALMSLNALVLLHTRRAMAESVLLFAVSWLLFAFAKKESNPLSLALPAALALNAKQTAAALVIVALIAVWVNAAGLSWQKRLRNVIISSTTILLITFLLNPVAWKDPISTARAALAARSDLAARQTEAIGSASPDLLMKSTSQRLTGWLVYLYISEPAVADVANYVNDTREAEQNYFANPLHGLLRGIIGGMAMLILSLLGFALAGFQTIRQIQARSPLILILLASLLAFLSLIFLIPLPFQRYVIFLIPFTNFWIAYLIVSCVQWLRKNRKA